MDRGAAALALGARTLSPRAAAGARRQRRAGPLVAVVAGRGQRVAARRRRTVDARPRHRRRLVDLGRCDDDDVIVVDQKSCGADAAQQVSDVGVGLSALTTSRCASSRAAARLLLAASVQVRDRSDDVRALVSLNAAFSSSVRRRSTPTSRTRTPTTTTRSARATRLCCAVWPTPKSTPPKRCAASAATSRVKCVAKDLRSSFFGC